jgi:hypothetical protein
MLMGLTAAVTTHQNQITLRQFFLRPLLPQLLLHRRACL